MARFDSAVVPAEVGDLMPAGYYQVKISEAKEDHFGDDNCLGWDLRLNISKPATQEGLTFFARLFGGTKDDPEAETTKTQRTSRGIRLLRRLCDATGVSFEQDTDVICEELRDRECIAHNKPRTYNGEEYNNLRDFFALGEAEVGVEQSAAGKPTGKPASQRTVNGSGTRLAGAPATRPGVSRQQPTFGDLEEQE